MFVSFLFFFKYKILIYVLLSILFIIIISLAWWEDVINEGGMGFHNFEVIDRLKWSMILFIGREVLFFFAWFWAFFHSRLNPRLNLGDTWPPAKVNTFNPFQLPLLNTIILLTSGRTVTWAHNSILNNKEINNSLIFTIILGFLFLLNQIYEYFLCVFSINDSIFGASFFVTTGFHGFHVFCGSFVSILLSIFKYP